MSGPTVAVIGSGAAAFAAAIRASERGARVVMIERGTLGGTCVNVGCVPSKILLRAAEVAHLQAAHPFAGLGRYAPALDRRALAGQMAARVEALREAKYEAVLASLPGVTFLQGEARFEDAHILRVARADGGVDRLRPDAVLVATGARPALPPVAGLAETPYWTSTEALASEETPPRLAVLGSSAVALELAQAFARLGSRVTVLARGRLLSREAEDVGAALAEAFRAEGIEVRTGARIEAVAWDDGRFRIVAGDGVVEAERLLVATGRRPNTDGLGLEEAGVAVEANGAIRVDERLRTTRPHVFAAGDCTPLPQLVYVAAAAGSRAGENMTGGDAVLDLSVLPWVIFTEPQVAAVGLDQAAAERRGIAVEVRTLPLAEVPRALANFETHGFVRIVAEAGSLRILGVQAVAPHAGELIEAAALAIRAGMTVDALAGELFPYLTWTEALKLCAQTFRRDVAKLSCCAA
ncbi:mercury(II) reductase [Inmirania thermothiophila]|uniref:Mercuric reductase n=1 Tax=Inmirania thermothiophila TaxID=1750597 RepID=A0A3N1Y0L0_9GAMM|nr:mercuric reductase [Inmirania thermothiophila]